MTRRSARQFLAAFVAFAVLGSCTSGAKTVERLTVVNSTAYDLEIRVKGVDDGGWALLGRVGSGARTVGEQVKDFGEVWVFQFRHGPRLAGELRVGRAELARNNWTVEVPKEVDERLRSEGIEPSRPA